MLFRVVVLSGGERRERQGKRGERARERQREAARLVRLQGAERRDE